MEDEAIERRLYKVLPALAAVVLFSGQAAANHQGGAAAGGETPTALVIGFPLAIALLIAYIWWRLK